ncbi:MAG: choice-of-anchor X domain-containing protein [Candidatus Binatia bacterium]
MTSRTSIAFTTSALLISSMAVAALVVVSWPRATPAITTLTPFVGTPQVNPSVVSVGQPTQVTVTSAITPAPIAGGVNLLRLDTAGKVIGILGIMHDDGKGGDAIPGDGIFTLQLTVNETAAGQMRLQVSAAFRGLLRRVLSPPGTLNIWQSVATNGLALNYPPAFQINPGPLSLGGPIALNNYGSVYEEGGSIPPGGADIDITSIPLPSSPLSDFITKELQAATITSTTTRQVGGEVGTEVLYTADFTPAATEKSVAVYVPHGSTLYKFFLSYNAGDPQEAQFLASFNQILNAVQFL